MSGDRVLAVDSSAAFVSYSRTDSEFALRLAADLKAGGAAVWLDQLDIVPGQRWDRAVRESLNNCPRLLVILSPASVDSENVLDEVDLALEQHKTIIPVLHRDCDTPLRLRRVQRVDFRTDYNHGLKSLLDALGVERQTADAVPASVASPTSRPEVVDADRQSAAEVARSAEEVRQQRDAAEAARLVTAEKAERKQRELREQAEAARLATFAEAQRKQVAEQAGLAEARKSSEAAAQQKETERQRISSEYLAQRPEQGPKAIPAVERNSATSKYPDWMKVGSGLCVLLVVAWLLYWSFSRPRPSEQTGGTATVASDPGGGWQPQGSLDKNLQSVAFATSQAGWAVGQGGTIVHTDDEGATWKAQNSGSSEYLMSVAFATPQSGWAVGHKGTILRTDDGGGTWKLQSSGTNQDLKSVALVTPQSGWAVGDSSTLLHTADGGRSWQPQNSNTFEHLTCITFVTPQLGWVVGKNGTVQHTEDGGSTWKLQSSGTSQDLYSVALVTPQSGWAVGYNGTILHTEDGGGSWKAQHSGTREWLWGVTFATPKSGWVVGRSGTILHTEDGAALGSRRAAALTNGSLRLSS